MILEIKDEALFLDHTLFSERNVASQRSTLTSGKYDLRRFDWDRLYSDRWISSGGSIDDSLKSYMMCECLLYQQISVNLIKTIHYCHENNAEINPPEYGLAVNIDVYSALFFNHHK